MGYEIPQELQYKEKILFGLSFEQLATLLPAAILAAIILKSNLVEEAKYTLTIIIILVSVGFAFFNLKDWIKRAKYYLQRRKLSLGDDKLKEYLGIKSIKEQTLTTSDGKIGIIEVYPNNLGLQQDQVQKGIITGFAKLLNGLNSTIQFLVLSNPLYAEEYTNQSEERVNPLLRKNVEALNNYFHKAITAEGTLNKNFYLVIKEKQNLEIEILTLRSQLSGVNLRTKRLEENQISELLQKFYNQQTENRSAKSQDSILRFSPKNITNQPDHIKIDNLYHRTLHATGYPRSVNPGFLSSIININRNISIGMFITPKELDETLVVLNRELQKQRADLFSLEKKGALNPSLSLKYEDTHNILKSVQKGEEKVFKISLYITITAKTKQALDELTSYVTSELNGNLIQVKNSLFRQLQGIKCVSPFCKDTLQEERTITTKPLSVFYPFTNQYFQPEKTGIWFGNNEQNIPLIKDVFKLSNPNGLVLATSGAGKSYLTKLLVHRNAIRGTGILIVDPQNEYSELVEAMHGEVININKNSKQIINPLDLMGHDYTEKRLSLLSLFEVMLGDVTDIQKSALDRALTKAYQKKGIANNEKTWKKEPPVLSDLLTELEQMGKKATVIEKPTYNSLINRLSMYVTGSFSFLNRQTKLNFKNKIVCFNIGNMPKQVKPVIMFLILDFVYQQMKNKTQERLLVIDEAWSLLGRAEEASYIFEIVKTSRKHKLGLLLITQDVADLLNSEAGGAVLANTAYTILLKQKPAVLDKITKTFNLSNPEKEHLLSAPVGSGVLIMDNEHSLLKVLSSPEEHELLEKKNGEIIEEEKQKLTIQDVERIGLGAIKHLTRAEVKYLLQKEFVISSHVPLGGGRRQDYLLKPEKNESNTHAFLMKALYSYLEDHAEKVETFIAGKPDIVYQTKGKKIAVEIETGSGLRKMKQMNIKLDILSEYDEWFFVVTDGSFAYKYEKLGQTYTRTNVLRKIRETLQTRISTLEEPRPKNSTESASKKCTNIRPLNNKDGGKKENEKNKKRSNTKPKPNKNRTTKQTTNSRKPGTIQR